MLDDIDIHIIEKLCRNGRTSLTDLSDGADISRVAIANRIEKLVKNRLLKVAPLLNLEKLNYNTFIVEMQIDGKKKNEFRKIIANCPKVLHSFELTGPFNHMLVCSAKSSKSLNNFIETILKKYADDCKVTLASNPQNSEFVHIKSFKECEVCKKCKGEK